MNTDSLAAKDLRAHRKPGKAPSEMESELLRHVNLVLTVERAKEVLAAHDRLATAERQRVLDALEAEVRKSVGRWVARYTVLSAIERQRREPA